MRPKQILDELLDCLDRRNWDEVETRANELLESMNQRLAPPTMVGPESLGPEWHRAVATFVCYAALSKVRDARKRKLKRAAKSR